MKIQTNTPSAEHIQQQQATIQQFDNALARCRDIFVKKLQDYGASWRILRPQSLTDQIYIKANRIRSLETKKESLVGDGILPEFIALVNYGIIGLIQLEKGFAETADMTAVQATELYDRLAAETRATMIAKNHDYDEAWRLMRVQSYTDIILQKIFRTKQIEDHHGLTLVSEGVDANYQDMINYSIFAIIKLTENA